MAARLPVIVGYYVDDDNSVGLYLSLIFEGSNIFLSKNKDTFYVYVCWHTSASLYYFVFLKKKS